MSKKKAYSPPALTKLTPKQARKLVADRKNCSEEAAVEFLESLRRQQPTQEKQNEQKTDEPKNLNRKDSGLAG